MACGASGFMGMGMGMPFMPVMSFGRRSVMTVATQGMFQTYEGLSKAVDSYNDVTKTEPLEGQRVRGVGCVGRWKVRGCGVLVE